MSAPIHRFRHLAMATEWEGILVHEDAERAERAWRRAAEEIDHLEDEMSRFRSGSYISQISRLEPNERLVVSQAVFDCLELAKAVHAETAGAFDISVGELYRAGPKENWVSGTEALQLDPEDSSVWVTRPGVSLDLGAIGKGHALDVLAPMLAELGVPNALLNAGESTILGLGQLPGEAGWPVRIGEQRICLRDQAISGSGFEVKGAHIFDPRTGYPLQTERRRAWVIAASAALSDAVSTAAMIMTEHEIMAFASRHSDITILIP